MLPDTFSHAWLDSYYLSLDFLRFLGSLLQSRVALATENLFLRKQLANLDSGESTLTVIYKVGQAVSRRIQCELLPSPTNRRHSSRTRRSEVRALIVAIESQGYFDKRSHNSHWLASVLDWDFMFAIVFVAGHSGGDSKID